MRAKFLWIMTLCFFLHGQARAEDRNAFRHAVASATVGCGLLIGCLGLLSLVGSGIAAADGKVCATAAMMDDIRMFDFLTSEESRRAQKAAKHAENMKTAHRWFNYSLIAFGTAGALSVAGAVISPSVPKLTLTGLPPKSEVTVSGDYLKSRSIEVVEGTATLTSYLDGEYQKWMTVQVYDKDQKETYTFNLQLRWGAIHELPYSEVQERGKRS